MIKIVITSLASLLIAVSVLTVSAPKSNAQTEPQVKGQIIVKFNDSRKANGVLRQFDLANGSSIGSTGALLIKVPEGKEQILIDALSRNQAVEYAELDQVVTAATSDEFYGRQYALFNNGQSFTNTAGNIFINSGKVDADVDAIEAWTMSTGVDVKVAVLDSGVASDNLDITPNVAARANFTKGVTGEDNYGHGTHVAGIIAAISDNGIGVSGVCPGCKILDGKVLDDQGYGSTTSIANGINWAVNNGAKVINMSLGQRTSSRTLESAVNNAWNKGVVIVAAAGNGGNTSKVYPGAYSNVIAVAATDNNDVKATFSTYGAKWVDVAAPGENVYSTFPNHPFYLSSQYGRSLGYDVANGTSMASPVVAGVAALAWGAHPTSTQSALRSRVESTAERIPGTGTYWAHGRVNAGNALR